VGSKHGLKGVDDRYGHLSQQRPDPITKLELEPAQLAGTFDWDFDSALPSLWPPRWEL